MSEFLVVPGITHTTGKTNWFTPEWLWKAAEKVMGGIDLDPCSNSKENPAVPASTLYTKEEDGLSKPWFGRVYMNPPWGRGVTDKWVGKAIQEYQEGRVSQVVLALPASTETKWFAPLYDYTICFAQGRCYFIDGAIGEVPPKGGPTPVCYVYMGEYVHGFTTVFREFGAVLQKTRRLVYL